MVGVPPMKAISQSRRSKQRATQCTTISATAFCLFLAFMTVQIPATNSFLCQSTLSSWSRVLNVAPISSSKASIKHISSSTTARRKMMIPRGRFMTQPPLSQSLPSNTNNNNNINPDMDKDGKDEFWQQQRQLVQDMTRKTAMSLKQEQMIRFRETQSKLIQETVLVSSLLFALLWLACDNFLVPFSFLFGAFFGLAYTYGLGKYVETLGGSIDDADDMSVQGAGVGQARFAFLILLFILVGKLRGSVGLMEIPSILGFFTYQIATLTQGLREE
jgi:hypothetical protein